MYALRLERSRFPGTSMGNAQCQLVKSGGQGRVKRRALFPAGLTDVFFLGSHLDITVWLCYFHVRRLPNIRERRLIDDEKK